MGQIISIHHQVKDKMWRQIFIRRSSDVSHLMGVLVIESLRVLFRVCFRCARFPGAQSLSDFRRNTGVAAAPRHRHQPGIIAAPFCLSGKCQGVIDIFLTAAFISLPCSRSYDLGSRWPFPLHSFLPYSSSRSGGGGEAYLTENSSIGFQRGVFHFETIFFFFTAGPSCTGAFLTQAIYFYLLFFSWDPTFQHVVWSKICCQTVWPTDVCKSHPVSQRRRWLRRRRWRCDTGAWKKMPHIHSRKPNVFSLLHDSSSVKRCDASRRLLAPIRFNTVVLLPFISTLFICWSNSILLLFSPWYAILIVSLPSRYNEGRHSATIFTVRMVRRAAPLFTGLIEFCRKSMASESPVASYLGWLCATWRKDSIKQTQLPFNSGTDVFAAGAASGSGDMLYDSLPGAHDGMWRQGGGALETGRSVYNELSVKFQTERA